MCRLLLVNKKQKFNPEEILNSFADMCEASRTPMEGDRQGDGWGVSWLDDNGDWQLFRSIKPIWEDRDKFLTIPESTLFMSHARSKSYSHNELNIEHNQPYLDGDLSYVFNGEMSGVMLKAEGEIGAQKIFNLLKKYSENNGYEAGLKKTRDQLNIGTKKLFGSNIILSDKQKAYILCNHWGETPDYHTIRYIQDDNNLIVCSEILDLPNYSVDNWLVVNNKTVINKSLVTK